MLDDLKKDRHAGLGAKEQARLAMYVSFLVLLGGAIAMGARCTPEKLDELASGTEEDVAPTDPGPTLDPLEVDRLVRAEGAEPDHWSEAGIRYLRRIQRTGSLGERLGRVTTADLVAGAASPGGAEGSLRGRYLEVMGRVTDVAREVYRGDSERLWTVVIEGEDGTPFLAVKHALKSEVAEGPPVDAKPPQVQGERIERGDWVLVRGVLLQQRVGSFGESQLGSPTPVVFADQWRIIVPPDQWSPVIGALDEALWGDIGDRFMAESRRWDEEPLYEVLRWARAKGREQIAADLKSGALPYETWGSKRFRAWSDEVKVDADTPRPLTDGSRGKIFRLSGIVGQVVPFDWEGIPRNRWGVDEFQVAHILADHYRSVAFQGFLPFPLRSFEDVEGEKKEHIYVYGVFVKNLTYDTKHRAEDDDSGRRHPITAPMFVVIHAERFPEEVAAERIRSTMIWVAAGMVLFGLLFYIVLIRGSRGQDKRMEAHRMALRKRARERAATKGIDPATPPPAGDAPPPGDG